jgi:hypothetical protein
MHPKTHFGARWAGAVLLAGAAGLFALTGVARAQDAPAALTLHLTPQHVSRAVKTGSASTGYSPAQIRRAYALPARGASGQRIAIVSAFNDPSIASDLAAYSKSFGLPGCTVASGCLSIRNQAGQASPLPETDPTRVTWETESSLGTESVHGICESCRIILYEADSPTTPDLSTAVNTAAEQGATVVVTTFEPVEDSTDTDYALDFSHEHTAIVSATGEALDATYGYGGEINFPASLPDVLAAGGTDLKLSQNGAYGSEQAWSDSVSGCSLFAVAAPWQEADAKAVGCGQMRAVADLAADANPGMLIYASHLAATGGPWYQATGTSVSAPILAAEIGLAGSLGSSEAADVYGHAKSDPSAFHHITTGQTSPTCTSRICRAGAGYNGPTGLGTPDGLAAFLKTGGALPAGTPDVSLGAGRTTVARSWKLALTVDNGLAIALSGQLNVLAKIHGRTVTLGSHTLALGALGTQATAVTIASRYRTTLSAYTQQTLTVELKVHGVGGRTATVNRSLTTAFPH